MFTAITTHPQPHRPKKNGQMRGPHKISDIIAMQTVLKEAVCQPDEPLSSRAQAARAWRDLEDTLRELRGKPRLAPVKVEVKRSRRASPIVLADLPTERPEPAPSVTTPAEPISPPLVP